MGDLTASSWTWSRVSDLPLHIQTVTVLELEPRCLAEPGSFHHALVDGKKSSKDGKEEEAEKTKGDERRKRVKKVRDKRVGCLFV